MNRAPTFQQRARVAWATVLAARKGVQRKRRARWIAHRYFYRVPAQQFSGCWVVAECVG